MEATYETDEAAEDIVVDQLQPGETLIDRGVDDALDEGIIAPFDWSPAQGFGNTAREMREGETLEMRIKQEVPEVVSTDDEQDWNPLKERRQVGSERAGRLVGHDHGYDSVDLEKESIGEDVGFAGGAASAEEAAMHIISDDDLENSAEDEGDLEETVEV
ncbi:DUF5709 domain-containing protein [Propionibacteriaceae bacterium G1746]|uniref:DUF5709 domain-containing protein n=1 Tax=Aestuariimicrobium sp. G57 TaxID=3418485 RepID=UPI003C248E16